MTPQLAGSIIAKAYCNSNVRGYNLPIFSNRTEAGKAAKLVEYFDGLSDLSEYKMMAYTQKMLSYDDVLPELVDDALLSTLMVLRFGSCGELQKKAELFGGSAEDILVLKQSVDDMSSEDSLKRLEDLHSKKTRGIIDMIELGMIAGLKSKSFEDAIRKCLYVGFSHELPVVICCYLMEHKIPSEIRIKCLSKS